MTWFMYMTPPRPTKRHPHPCDECHGRGHYPVEDHPTDAYCDCAAGQMRRRADDGENEEALCAEMFGCSRADLWEA